MSRDPEDFKIRDFFGKINNDFPCAQLNIKKTKCSSDPEFFYSRTLDVMALNDVYIGEKHTSLVSNLDLKYKTKDQSYYKTEDSWIDHLPQKNSGVVLTTGTGSTGWSSSINYINTEAVRTVLQKFRQEGLIQRHPFNRDRIANEELARITEEINEARTTFSGTENYLGLTFREPIRNKISSLDDSNYLKISCLQAKSKLKDGFISIDGTIYYDFSRGSIVDVICDPKYAIECLQIN